MSVGFGFSAGDFIAGIQLVRDVIASLQSSAGSASEYQALIYELFTLERALLEVKSLRFEDCEAAQLDALKAAATHCQSTIDRFLAKIKKYQPSLNAQGSGSRIRDSLRKIQWALCSKADLGVFQAEVRGHTGSINILLATVQMNQAHIHHQRTEKRQQGISSTLNEYFLGHMRALGSLGAAITTCAKQGQQLLHFTAAIVQSNLRIYQMVLQTHTFIQGLPLQIEQKQPVYFIDAFGKESPFFLEWVYSAEVLQDWLERRFEATGRDKIIRNEFVLEDTKTRRELDLSKPWDTLFYPGMRVGMDMVFIDMDCHYKNSCPACHTVSSGNLGEDIICSHCGVNVRPVTILDEITGEEVDASNGENDSEKPTNTRKRKRPFHSYLNIGTKDFDKPFLRRNMGIEEPSQFRRVRLLSSKQLSLFKPRCRAGPLSKKARAAAKAIRKIAALDASLNVFIYRSLRPCVRGGSLVNCAKTMARNFPDRPTGPSMGSYLYALAESPTLRPRDYPGLNDRRLEISKNFFKRKVNS